MSITYTYDQIDESQGELTTNSISYERKYRVIASETAEEAGVIGYMNGRIAAAGLKNIGTAFCDSISAEAQDGSQNKIWEVTVRWKRQRKEQETNYPKQIPLVYEESFQTSGERKHLSFARSEDVYTRTGYAGSNVFSMIGTHGEGVDVDVPVFNFSLKRRFNYADVTPQVRNTWLNLFGCLNSDIFFAYEPGVVKFTGFSGQSVVEYDGTLTTIDGVIYQAAQVYYDITFSFQGKPIAINETIGGIVCATVPGWAHVWPEVVMADDPTTGRTVEMPVAIHVSDIHRYAAFNEVF